MFVHDLCELPEMVIHFFKRKQASLSKSLAVLGSQTEDVEFESEAIEKPLRRR